MSQKQNTPSAVAGDDDKLENDLGAVFANSAHAHANGMLEAQAEIAYMCEHIRYTMTKKQTAPVEEIEAAMAKVRQGAADRLTELYSAGSVCTPANLTAEFMGQRIAEQALGAGKTGQDFAALLMDMSVQMVCEAAENDICTDFAKSYASRIAQAAARRWQKLGISIRHNVGHA
ncbi:hypothetical protein [Komagataeibacter xylinus]|uniref:hypothetical protein n=1 Tax=Komagataeibacter xylinus TaxID=28448 RepID=UPI0010308F94|nr:hypothetical protein [Komagataeibacter xylinus]